jgi:hypothetical protein
MQNLNHRQLKPTISMTLAGFEGDNPSNVTDIEYTPNGTRYAACTTIQYGYKPSSNTVTLTVEPPATQVIAASPDATVTQTPESTTVIVPPAKTPEQMQAEAEQSGQLTKWHEFLWWYPWYRIHYVYWYSGSMEFDLGKSVLPLADTVQYAEMLLRRIWELLPKVSAGIAGALVGAEFTALVASNIAGPVGFLAALGISLGTKLLALATYYNNIDGLISTYIGTVFSTILSLVKAGFVLWVDFVKLLLGIKSLAEFGWGKLCSIFSVPINILFLGRVHQRLHDLGVLP